MMFKGMNSVLIKLFLNADLFNFGDCKDQIEFDMSEAGYNGDWYV